MKKAIYDNDLSKALMGLGSKDNGRIMKIGFLNESGEIYRSLEVSGLTDFMEAINKILKFGLKDTIEDEIFPVNGFDAIFIKL